MGKLVNLLINHDDFCFFYPLLLLASSSSYIISLGGGSAYKIFFFMCLIKRLNSPCLNDVPDVFGSTPAWKLIIPT